MLGDIRCEAVKGAKKNLRNESQADADGTKPPLLVHRLERLKKREDQRVRKPAEKRKPEDDGLGEEHIESSKLLQRHSPLANLIRTIHVRVLARLSFPLCLAIQQNCRPRLGIAYGVENLSGSADDQLDPEDPRQGAVLLNKTTYDGANDGSSHRGQHEERDSVLVIVSLETMKGFRSGHTSCSSGSHISASTPSVTDPPAVESPPNVRQTI